MDNFLKSTTFRAILACMLWSTAFVGVKIGLRYHTPLQFAGIRFFISGLMILLFLGKFRLFLYNLKTYWRLILKLSIVQVFFIYAFFYSGINLVPSSLAAMIIGSQPLFIAIVSHFSLKNDKMTLLKTSSILIGVVGISIITLGRQKVEFKGELELLGIALLLINNIISGFANIIVSKSPAKISPMVLSSSSLMIGGLMLLIVSIPVEGLTLGPFPLTYYYALAWLSFLSAAAITIWYALLKRPGVKVSILNVWKFLIPVLGAILGWIIMADENPDVVSIIGMVAISISLLLLNYSNRKNSKKIGLKQT